MAGGRAQVPFSPRGVVSYLLGASGSRRGGLLQAPPGPSDTAPLGAGYRVKEACGELTGTLCVPCDPGTYTAHLNGLSECLQCRVCDPGKSPGRSRPLLGPHAGRHLRTHTARTSRCLHGTLPGSLGPLSTPVSPQRGASAFETPC